jgi:DNA (cytosine-5)-methyltransferase 1
VTRPRLLDLFCCAGGAAVGYHRAGFDVVGVDIEPQPNYPFRFVKADALEFAAAVGDMFDAIHASPPCQAYSVMTAAEAKPRHPQLIAPTQTLLRQIGRPYVIENVEGARRHLDHPVKLCGSFGLRIRRHRYFEVSFPAMAPPCAHRRGDVPVGIYGDHPDSKRYTRPDGTFRGTKARTVEDAGDALGIDWMTWLEMAESIPPAYTEFLGGHLLAHITEAAA